jgi:hypothetical protein
MNFEVRSAGDFPYVGQLIGKVLNLVGSQVSFSN